MGLFDMFKNQSKAQSVDYEIDQLRNDVARARAENAAWKNDFSSTMGDRAMASRMEKESRIGDAIVEYEKCVERGMASSQFNIYNYAHDIDRLAILYRKTKQLDKEISFLERMIDTHRNYEGSVKWKERLKKAKKLNSNSK